MNRQQFVNIGDCLTFQESELYTSLYNHSNILDSLNYYIAVLNKTHILHNSFMANTVQKYVSTVFDKVFRKQIKQTVLELSESLSIEHPNSYFTLSGRVKTIKSFMEKAFSLQEKHESLEKLRDILAFKFVLHEKDDNSSIMQCYDFANFICEYLTFKGFIICEPSKLLDVRTDNLEIPGIYIPEKSSLNSYYINLIKDYISNPKKRGYQGLHTVGQSPCGRFIEIQICTHKMEDFNNLVATHKLHKAEQSAKRTIDINYSNINMNGFNVYPQNSIGNNDEMKISDYIGLIDPLILVRSEHTFLA